MKLKKPSIDNPNRKGSPDKDLEVATTNNLAKRPRGAKRQLNIAVSEETLREFRIYSAVHGITKSQLWNLVWKEWRARNP
ncbi:hypothetical protein [Cohaesibacter marisflavi]|uniref:hypothetical protein n=1 Tax=Cohaesibacter marisflavi TaxID=655353 RepID=UPI0029C8C962|nr:hypothetical protein [Cohaesibacter marisflavi]